MTTDTLEVTALVCDECGATAKTKAGLASHARKHNAESRRGEAAMGQPIVELTAPIYEGEPAYIPEWRSLEGPWIGQRMVKMLRPMCQVCQMAQNRRWNWWETCTHDPYVTVREVPVREPKWEDEVVGGRKTGRRKQVGFETFVTYVPQPNVRQVALTMKVNSGRGIERARRLGCIMPSELRSPHYPFGIAEVCQFRECFEQKGLQEYTTGTFCREVEAALVLHAEGRSGHALEIGFDDRSAEIRDEQLTDWGKKVRR